MRIVKGTLLLAGALVLASRAGWGSSLFQSAAPHRPFRADATRVSVRPRASLNGAARAAGFVTALGVAQSASAARSGGRAGGRISGGGGGYRGGGGGYRGGATNVYVAPSYGFSPFGFSPFGFGMPFSPFGFGFGFGLPLPLLLLVFAGVAATSFRSSRGISGGFDDDFAASDKPGAALCLQVACYCPDRRDSLYARLTNAARTADTDTAEGLQSLVSDSCLAMLRSSKDWLAARTTSETAGVFSNDVDAAYNKIVVTERSKWETEQKRVTRTSMGEPTYMVATVIVLLRDAKPLGDITGTNDLRTAIQDLAAAVSVEDNLLGAEVLWTPEDDNDVMDRDEMYLSFPELIAV